MLREVSLADERRQASKARQDHEALHPSSTEAAEAAQTSEASMELERLVMVGPGALVLGARAKGRFREGAEQAAESPGDLRVVVEGKVWPIRLDKRS
jgi:hypothetical protein